MSYYNSLLFLFLGAFLLPVSPQAQTTSELKNRLIQTEGRAQLQVLQELTSAYHRQSLDTSVLFARQAIQLAETLENDSLLADAHLRLCPSFSYMGLSDSMLKHASIAKEIGEELASSKILGYACQLLASAYDDQANYAQGLLLNEESLQYYRQLKDTIGISAIHNNLANLHLKTGNFAQALEYALTAEKLSEITGRRRSQGLAMINIAEIYYDMGQNDKYNSYLHKAMGILTRDSFPRRHATLLMNVGNNYLQAEQIDSSIYCFEQALAIYQEIGDLNSTAVAYGNLGSIYQHKEDWNKSRDYLHRSRLLKIELNDPFALSYDIFNLGALYEAQGIADSTEYYFKESLRLAEEYDVATIREVSLEELYKHYEKQGAYQTAIDYHKRYVAHLNDNKGEATANRIAELEAQYESEKKDREIERLALQAAIAESETRASRIGLGSLALTALLLLGGLWYRRKNEQKVSALRQKMHEQEKHKLDQELDYKTKQLTSHALHMVQKNKVLQAVKQEISSLAKTANGEDKKALRALVRRIDFNIQSDEDWNTFRLYFEQTNHGFYEKLALINNDLTGTELKLCSLIKLNMNIKETASVLNIEPTSVKTARHRLRKKLNLKQGQDLASFIRQVA